LLTFECCLFNADKCVVLSCCVAAFKAMLASRSFQAGAKLLLATGSALVLTILLMVYDVRVRR
jgi:hypothetical protein